MKFSKPRIVIAWEDSDGECSIAALRSTYHRSCAIFPYLRYGEYGREEKPLLLLPPRAMRDLMREADIFHYWFPTPEQPRLREMLGFEIREVLP